MNLAEVVYAIDVEAGLKEVLEGLGDRFRVSREAAPERHRVYYETFDWRLYKAGGRLTARWTESGVTLRWEDADGTLRHQQLLDEMPDFVWDLPAGAFRDDLKLILKMRRLLPLVEVRCRAQALRVLDDEEKTVARMRLEKNSAVHPEKGAAGGGPLPTALLRVLPVKGYVAVHRRLLRFVEDELGLASGRQDELTLALAAIGRVPGDYSAKLNFVLDPALRADEATKTIFRSLLHTMEANEDGLRQDLDSEFLHDFRVAGRRTRSALSQVKGVLPAAAVTRFGAEFKWLGNATGPTRDLDVYLLKIPGYRAELPPGVRQNLEPLAKFLEARQRTAHKRLVKALDSTRYRELIRSWSDFLLQPAEPPSDAAPPNAARPILEVASERIWKVYRKVLKEGGAIGPETEAEALHDLRIRCKKLRYLLEFFRSMYDEKVICPLIKRLKLLQDNLGDFNDYEVQQDSLKEFAHQMMNSGKVPADTLMAMGRLVEHLEVGQANERKRFHECFDRFAAKDNRRRFRKLFRPAGKGGKR